MSAPYQLPENVGIVAGSDRDEELQSHSASWGKQSPHVHWSDMKYFIETGGVLMQHLLFRAMIESVDCANVPVPPLRTDAHSRVQRNTRLRARWAARAKREAIMDARAWVRDAFPPLWRFTFKTDPARIVNWLAGEWPKCDADATYAAKVKRVLSECLKKEERDDRETA